VVKLEHLPDVAQVLLAVQDDRSRPYREALEVRQVGLLQDFRVARDESAKDGVDVGQDLPAILFVTLVVGFPIVLPE